MAKNKPGRPHVAAPHTGTIDDRIAWAKEFNPSGVHELEREKEREQAKRQHAADVEGTTRKRPVQ